MPGVDPRLVSDFASLVAFNGGFIGGDGPPSTNGAEVTGDKWGPLKVVGAFESGDTANIGGGHFCKGLVLE